MDSTRLRIAAQEIHVAIAGLLIRHGADKEIESVISQTPLLRAADSNFFELLKLWLENGADHSRDAAGRHGSSRVG